LSVPADRAAGDIAGYMDEVCRAARTAARALARADTASRNSALHAAAASLVAQREHIAAANARDLSAGRERGLDAALLDRLELTPARLDAMIEGLRTVAALADPVGRIDDLAARPSGIRVGRMRVPLGVIGIIYESRPNVTADAAALCLKAGNACILRGGSEAHHTNAAIGECLAAGLTAAGLPPTAAQVIATTERTAVGHLLAAAEQVDLIIPRGGRSLIERVAAESRIPVLKHLDGICHVYIDAAADPHKAHAIAVNAKTHRLGVCNAMETLLVDRAVAATCCRASPTICGLRASNCAVAPRPVGSSPMPCPPPRPTGPPSTWARYSPSASSMASMPPSTTSRPGARAIPMPSSRSTGAGRSASCARSTRPR